MFIRNAISARKASKAQAKAEAESVAIWSNINSSALPVSHFLEGRHRMPLSELDLFADPEPKNYLGL